VDGKFAPVAPLGAEIPETAVAGERIEGCSPSELAFLLEET
jgi:hypothetical protein